MSQETYAKAPIVEAALDVRVRPSTGTTVTTLEKIRDSVYPELFRQPVRIDIQIGATSNGSQPQTSATNTNLGFAYKNPLGSRVFQVRSDGFTLNELAPYSSWESFSEEAKRLWPIYRSGAQPEAVELLGLSYLNEIFIPVNSPANDYFNTYIEIPKSLPQTLDSFSSQFQITSAKHECFIQVAQTYGQNQREGCVSIILNIQAFRHLNLPLRDLSDETMWKIFESLRDAKNEMFESAITDKVRRELRA